jgi:hypothetical protein
MNDFPTSEIDDINARLEAAEAPARVEELVYALKVMRLMFHPRGGEPGPDMHAEVIACNNADLALNGEKL